MEAHRLAGLALLVAALTMACADGNVHTDSFASMVEARERGAVQRGWVPAVLPDGAFELRAAYDVDGWRRWGLFNFRPADAEALRAVLQPEETPLEGTAIGVPRRIEWWPIALRGRLQPDTISSTGLRAYRARAGDLVFAVNWNQGRAYYWTAR
ncbi:MAG TPA: hypothetical protein VM364_06960 [Vicinamibacterales bacterium]|nr:hypothetical protein [Vicinamibacterales bacterium]